MKVEDMDEAILSHNPFFVLPSEAKLIHREQVPFYTHDYQEGYVPCSHLLGNQSPIAKHAATEYGW